MRKTVAVTFLLLAASVCAFTQIPFAQTLFNQVRQKVLNDVTRAPRYTCVQTITRVQYRPHYPGGRPNACSALIQARKELASPGTIIWRDRLRFDVAISNRGEMFSWAGATEFESGELSDLALSGSTGSGDFASFLSAVFGPDAEQFHYLGPQDTPFGLLSAFDFKVPIHKSHYSYKSEGHPARTIGYGGTFYAQPDSGDLKRLVIDTDQFPQGDSFCHVVDTMDYGHLKVGSGDFLLPTVARMDILYSNGEESQNEKRYSNCREFTGTSTLRFDDNDEVQSSSAQTKQDLQSLPPKTHIKVRIDPPISSVTAAAGDAVIGIVEKEVRNKGQVLVRATDRLHGRILRFEQFQLPDPHWLIAIRFDAIERDGVEQRMTFAPVDDGERGLVPRRGIRPLTPAQIAADRPKGGGVFLFATPARVTLDKNFHTEWETR